MTDPVVPRVVVLAARRPATGAAAVLPAGRADVLGVLLASCLNTGTGGAWEPGRAWTRLTTLARSLEGHRMEYDRPQDGAQALLDLVG